MKGGNVERTQLERAAKKNCIKLIMGCSLQYNVLPVP